MQPGNREILAAGGVIVLMEVSPETVAHRLKDDHTRPLLDVPDKQAAIRELMGKRLPIYRSVASIIVDGNRPAGVVAAEIRNACKFYIDKKAGL